MSAMFLLAALVAQSNHTCTGPQLQIASVTPQLQDDAAAVNHYALHVVVTNTSSDGQASNVLQSVSVYQDGLKVGEKGIPPLKADRSYAFDQLFKRSDEARSGSTSMRFDLHADRNSDACYASPVHLNV